MTNPQSTEPLLDFIPRVSPRLDKPTWLAPFVELLDRAIWTPLRETAAAPPQHGKTECVTHALIKALKEQPSRRHAYATYNSKRTARVEGKTRLLAERAGLKLRFRQDQWVNEQTGGSLLWASRQGGFTGEPVDGLLVIDDILKDRQEAESALILDRVRDWFDDVAEARCHPSASIIAMMTRWSKRDLVGLLRDRGWPYLNMQALADGEVDEDGRVIDDPLNRFLGEALCEARRSKASLEQKRRVNAFSFASLYQGAPRPRGGTVFGPPTYYDELPTQYRVGYGVDLAYTAKTSSNYSVVIEGWMTVERMPADAEHDNKPWLKHQLYIISVQRAQVQAPEFTLTLHSKWRIRRGPMRWYCATSEQGAGQFVKKKVRSFEIKLATADKFIRATPAAEAWNAGNVLVPSRFALGLDPDDLEEPDPEWLTDFLDEIGAFTGVSDVLDDQVDSLAALWDTLQRAGTGGEYRKARKHRAKMPKPRE